MIIPKTNVSLSHPRCLLTTNTGSGTREPADESACTRTGRPRQSRDWWRRFKDRQRKNVEAGEEAKHSAGRGLKLWLLCRLSETIVMGLGASGQGTDPGQCWQITLGVLWLPLQGSTFASGEPLRKQCRPLSA